MMILKKLTKLLVVIGALNWGLVGFFQYDLVTHLFGGAMYDVPEGARIVFGLVGIAGLLCLICCVRRCCGCKDCDCDCNCKSCGKR